MVTKYYDLALLLIQNSWKQMDKIWWPKWNSQQREFRWMGWNQNDKIETGLLELASLNFSAHYFNQRVQIFNAIENRNWFIIDSFLILSTLRKRWNVGNISVFFRDTIYSKQNSFKMFHKIEDIYIKLSIR